MFILNFTYMNIQRINVYSNYKKTGFPAQKFGYTPVFCAKKTTITDKLSSSGKNPVVCYAKDIFKRSLAASARRITPVIPELEPITKEISIASTPADKTYAWDIENNKSKKYVLYLHGASQNITNIQHVYKSIIDNSDFSVLALEYRGFGKNNGRKFRLQDFWEDTKAAVDYLENDKNIEGKDIFVVGHSMGTYPASQIASKRPELGRLVLISPLGSVAIQPLDVNLWFAKRMSPFVKFLFKNFKILRMPLADFFKIDGYIQDSEVPVDIIHARNDRLIKFTASQSLAEMCPNLHSLSILKQGGHKMEKHKIDSILALLNGN